MGDRSNKGNTELPVGLRDAAMFGQCRGSTPLLFLLACRSQNFRGHGLLFAVCAGDTNSGGRARGRAPGACDRQRFGSDRDVYDNSHERGQPGRRYTRPSKFDREIPGSICFGGSREQSRRGADLIRCRGCQCHRASLHRRYFHDDPGRFREFRGSDRQHVSRVPSICGR